MRKILFVVMLVCLSGCEVPIRPEINYPDFKREYPRVNIERYLRQKNWIGRKGQGSCTHSSLVMLLRHMGEMKAAEYWRQKYGDGETFDSLASKLDAENFRWAGTWRQNDVAFLEWAIATRRGALVTCRRGAHAILLVHLDKDSAYLIDNNKPDRTIKMSRQQFLTEWRNSNSWGITIVGTPPPPKPYKEQNK